MNEHDYSSELSTLRSIEEAPAFNKWMFETIRPYCFGNVLEIGSGIGNISRFLLNEFPSVTLSDYKAPYVQILQDKFKQHPNLKEIIQLDISKAAFESEHSGLVGSFDTVVALNVVEHIEDDLATISNIRKLLKEKGHMVILVPAQPWLFNSFDRELGHYRRYTQKRLRRVMHENSLSILAMRYFNVAGMAGWFLNGSLLKKKQIPKNQLAIYNKLIPVIKIADMTLNHFTGLSLIAIGKK